MTTPPTYRTIGSCDIEISQPCCLVIFGGFGDLTKRKLLPALQRLYTHRLLPQRFFILATDIVDSDTEGYRQAMRDAAKTFLAEGFNGLLWEDFARILHYASFDFSDRNAYETSFKGILPPLEKAYGTEGNRVYYLAVPPILFETVTKNLEYAGLSELQPSGYPHMVIEKPFGRDLDSARQLNNSLTRCFTEGQIFRIDHYIAKETVQNMLIFRFGNSIFEPLWNRAYIDHIQITVSETLGIEHRAPYYEEVWGVLRDMFQSHVFQLASIAAMEPPVRFEADYVRDEKAKVLRSIRRFDPEKLDQTVTLGQYGRGIVEGIAVPSYREEPGVSAHSNTPTFAAMKLFMDNWRWDSVPFYLRSGKRLGSRKTEISIHFKRVPHIMFSRVLDEPIEPNVLIFRLQPDEGVNLAFHTKQPGSRLCLNPQAVTMEFTYDKGVFLDAYEWVLLDCMSGDQMLFLREDGVEETWALLTPLLEKLEETITADRLSIYPAGSSGPGTAESFIEIDGRAWRPL